MPSPGFFRGFLLLFLLCSVTVVLADEPDPNYWRLEEIIAQFAEWETAYPDIFHPGTFGRSGQAVNIPVVCISDVGPDDAQEPRLLFHGALHANEANGTTAIMKSIATLLEGYGSDPQITKRVDGLELYYVPILNVDGHNHVFSGGVNWADWRKTMRDNNNNGVVDFPDDGVDLNRNWDWNWDQYGEDQITSQKYKGPHPFSEPEIVAVKAFILRERPTVVVDYHSPVTISWRNYVFWPWLDTNGGGGMGPDADVAGNLADLWADNTMNENGNSYNNIYAYSTLPKGQCWIYGNTGILAFIMEISDHCWWSGATVDTVGFRVSRGSMTLVDRVLDGPGIQGTVTRLGDGQPLVAEVKIHEMHQESVGPRFTEQDGGTFHRLTEDGTYTVTVSCEGYDPETKTVTVSGGWEKVNFVLSGDMSGVAPEDELRWISTGHVLGSGGLVFLEMPDGMPSARAELFDIRGRRLGVLGSGLGAGRHELSLPQHLGGGVYLLRVSAGDKRQTSRIVIVP